MGRKGVDCGCSAREDILDRLAALRQRVEVLETEINQVESQFPDVLRDVRSAEASAVSAAESAESSREIVEGYDDRLGAVEQGVIDVNDYAEAIGDDVSAIDTEIHTTRPYMSTNTEQTVTAKKHIPTATANDSSDVWVNKAFVQATDGRNNLVHNIGNESIGGAKTFQSLNYLGTTRSNGWRLLWRFKGDRGIPFIMVGGRTIILGIANREIVRTRVLSDSETGRTYPQPIFKVGYGSDGERYIFVKGSYSAIMHIHYLDAFLHGNLYPIFDAIEWIGEDVDEPVVGDTYTQVIDSVDFGYAR